MTAGPGGTGSGDLSPEALARLARGVDDPPLAFPDLDDPVAVAAWRGGVHEAWGEGTVDGEPEHLPAPVGGVDCLVAGPPDAPVVVYLHGGGYALGSPGVAAPITARLAGRLRVVSVGYRLAPEHRFPAALDDAVAVVAAVSAAGPGPVALAGDSAGGALAVGAALRALRAGVAPPSCLVLLCPHLDHVGAAAPADGADPAPRGAAMLAASYRGATAADDPLLSPAHADLAGLPPVLVQSGTRDALAPQAIRFARRARTQGVAVTLDLWDGLWHTWQYHRGLPEADQALAEAVAFIEQAVAGPRGVT